MRGTPLCGVQQTVTRTIMESVTQPVLLLTLIMSFYVSRCNMIITSGQTITEGGTGRFCILVILSRPFTVCVYAVTFSVLETQLFSFEI